MIVILQYVCSFNNLVETSNRTAKLYYLNHSKRFLSRFLSKVSQEERNTNMELNHYRLRSEQKLARLIQPHHMLCRPKNAIHHPSTSQPTNIKRLKSEPNYKVRKRNQTDLYQTQFVDTFFSEALKNFRIVSPLECANNPSTISTQVRKRILYA